MKIYEEQDPASCVFRRFPGIWVLRENQKGLQKHQASIFI
jgi:hypothetical protein